MLKQSLEAHSLLTQDPNSALFVSAPHGGGVVREKLHHPSPDGQQEGFQSQMNVSQLMCGHPPQTRVP